MRKKTIGNDDGNDADQMIKTCGGGCGWRAGTDGQWVCTNCPILVPPDVLGAG